MIRYEVVFRSSAIKDLDRLPQDVRRRVLIRIEAMQDGLSGDIKKLSQHAPGYRLRVGDYRVLFDLEGRRILIADVKHRREAYS